MVKRQILCYVNLISILYVKNQLAARLWKRQVQVRGQSQSLRSVAYKGNPPLSTLHQRSKKACLSLWFSFPSIPKAPGGAYTALGASLPANQLLRC